MNDTSSKRKQSPEEIIAEKIAALIAADATIKKLKAELEEAQAERQIAVDALMPFFEESGVSSISMKGLGKLAYLYRQIWAGTADEVENQAVVDVLKKSGMAHMVTYNHMSLSGWVREQAKLAGQADATGKITATPEEVLKILPTPFQKVLRITEKIDIRVRKA